MISTTTIINTYHDASVSYILAASCLGGCAVILSIIGVGIFFGIKRQKRKRSRITKGKRTLMFMDSTINSSAKQSSQGVSSQPLSSELPPAVLRIDGKSIKDKRPFDDFKMVPLSRIVPDPSKPYERLNYWDYIGKELLPVTEQYYAEPKVITFLTRKFPVDSKAASLYTPDALMYQALRLPDIDSRATKLLQALIQGNNKLYDMGFHRNKEVRRDPDLPIECFISIPPEYEAWFQKSKEGQLLRFILSTSLITFHNSDGEFEEDPKFWKTALEKFSINQTFIHACIFGQSLERRKFFLMATYFKMAELMARVPEENLIEKMDYPIPMMLDIVRDLPHYFIVDDDPDNAKEAESPY